MFVNETYDERDARKVAGAEQDAQHPPGEGSGEGSGEGGAESPAARNLKRARAKSSQLFTSSETIPWSSPIVEFLVFPEAKTRLLLRELESLLPAA